MRLKGYKKKKISDYLGRGIIIIVMSVIGAIIFINSFSKRAEEILLRNLLNMYQKNINKQLYIVNRDNEKLSLFLNLI